MRKLIFIFTIILWFSLIAFGDARVVRDFGFILTVEKIERNITEWKDCGLPYAEITSFDGRHLNRPLIVVRKEGLAKTTFYRHLTCKLLEKYFIEKGRYYYEHIPIPIAFENGKYYYVFSQGLDHLPIHSLGIDITLDEWREFVSAFKEAGFFVDKDINYKGSDIIANNIILNLDPTKNLDNGSSAYWNRVDFDFESLPSPLGGVFRNNELWESFFETKREDLKNILGEEKFKLLEISSSVLQKLGNIPSNLMQEFEEFFYRYQSELLEGYF